MKLTLTISILLLAINGYAQQSEKFNLGFENQKEKNGLSDGWMEWGDYDASIDTLAKSGVRSGKITSAESDSFGSIAFLIPANYEGKIVRLEGYMKIKNVENGYAGLLMRIDGNGGTLGFNNMQKQNISGTKDWQKYSIILDYPEEAERIYVGGILTGKGEAWFDDFVLTINGKNIQTLQEVEEKLTKAQLDKEFDDGSQIEISDLTANNMKNLELLGRVWGFLKYHHPQIAGANYNWDYELFRFLPGYLKTRNEEERNNALINWIESLGTVDKCSTCKPTDAKAVLKPDLKWIDRQKDELKNRLLHVYDNRSQSDHYYIELARAVENPIFKNENSYSWMPYPDDGFRLLALFRYWNMINYFFPYKHLMDKDWNTTLREYIPLFINAENELEYEFAAVQLIGDIQDSHANLWGGADKIDEWKGVNYPPVHVRFIEDQLVVTDYYNEELKNKVGLQVGDVITKVNGTPIENLVKEKSKYYPASNRASMLRNISADLLRSNTDEIEIAYKSANSKKSTTVLQLYPKDSLDIYRWYRRNKNKCYKLLNDNIGYVTLASIRNRDVQKIRSEFKHTKGIIIDIRNYPSNFIVFDLGSYFVSSNTPFAKFTKGNTNNPGEFTFTDSTELSSEEEAYKGKLIVLVNELTQSQAEYTAMAFRAGENTTIIGSTTAGADGNVSSIMLPGGLKTAISGISVNYPDGGETQRIGIVPDIEVKPTIEGIRAARDELMEKAIALIKQQ